MLQLAVINECAQGDKGVRKFLNEKSDAMLIVLENFSEYKKRKVYVFPFLIIVQYAYDLNVLFWED